MARKTATRPEVRVDNPLREAAPLAVLERPKHEPLEFTTEQRKMMREMFAEGASDSEFAVLLEIARLKRLNPITGQCHFNQYLGEDGNGRPRYGKKWAVQTSIDGFRSKAEEHPAYDGQSPKEYLFSDGTNNGSGGGQLVSCTVRVYRKDRAYPFEATCFLNEYQQVKKDGFPTKMWEKRMLMLGKCTEAAGLRGAFPDELGGLHTDDEIPDEVEINPMPPKQEKKPAAPPEDAQIVSPAATTPSEPDPKKATPEERLEHIRETIKVATDPAELRLCWTDAKTALPPEMFEQVKQMCFARNAELDMIAAKGPLAKPREPTVTLDPAATRAPGEEG